MNDITFKSYRQDIIEYLSQQDEFKDYNFTAPAISTLVDALAYVGYRISVYSNFALNEVFLDTAQERSSVVSKAKNIGYTPYQYTCSTAVVRMNYGGKNNLDNKCIRKGASFKCTIDGKDLYFRTNEDTDILKNSIGRYFVNLRISEGTEITQTWTQNAESNVRFELSNPKVDTSSIKVFVYSSSSDTIGEEYTYLKNVAQLGPKNAVYLVEENTNGNVEIIFGDGIISKKINPNNVVKVTYKTSEGSIPNGVTNFRLVNLGDNDETGTYLTDWTIECIEPANGGCDRENISSIKRNAPRFYQRQDRNVISEDYKTAILSEFGGVIESISCWGGENNVPPMYGSVIVCIKPKYGTILTEKQKNEISKSMTANSVIGITTRIIDPNILYVNMTVNVQYDKLKTVVQKDSLQDSITNIIMDYFNNSASSFNTKFVYSKFLGNIFGLDEAISDVETDITLYQYITPVVGTKFTYDVSFKNSIQPNSVYIGPYISITSLDTSEKYLADDGEGNINMYSSDEAILTNNVGTVDYESGDITIKNFNFSVADTTSISVMAKPLNNNMSVTNEYVFSLNNITVILNNE